MNPCISRTAENVAAALDPRSRRLFAAAAVTAVALLGSARATHGGQATAVAGYFNTPSFEVGHASDIALTGRDGWNTLPVAFSRNDGTFTVTNYPVGYFSMWAALPGVSKVVGDFNGDQMTDIALVGASGWTSVVVAFSTGEGNFHVTLGHAPLFTSQLGAVNGVSRRVLSGDFDGDGKLDIVAAGALPGLPAVLSNGDGTFRESPVWPPFSWPDFYYDFWRVGDFDGDGRDDLQAMHCGAPAHLVLAFSSLWGHSGQFNQRIVIPASPGEDAFVRAACGCSPLVGHFDRDAVADIAVIGPSCGDRVVVGFFKSRRGSYSVTDNVIGQDFVDWSRAPGVRSLVADFDGDGLSDIALLGNGIAPALPVAFSNGDGTFRVTNVAAGSFPGWSSGPTVTSLVGDFNRDGRADIALTGGVGWNTLPVAFSNGDGSFNVTNRFIGDFATWAAPP